MEEVVETMKNFIEKFDAMQEDINQLKKGTLPQGSQNDSSQRSQSKSRDT